MALLPLAAACGRASSTAASEPPDPVVATWADVEVRASDVRHALAVRPSAPADAAVEVLVDEILARRARSEVPGAAARAAAAGRRAAIDQLLEADLAIDPADIDRYYRAHEGELRRPAEVRLARIELPDCGAARALRTRLESGELDFAVAAMQHSIDRDTRLTGGDLGWLSIEQLSPADLAALAELDRPGAVSAPFPDGDLCRLLRLTDRRAESTPGPDQARAWARMRLLTERRGEARRTLLGRLDETARVRIDDDALEAALAGRALADPAAPVVSLGDDDISAAELRAGLPASGAAPGGASAWRRRLAEDLALWREARRRGLHETAAVRAAARASLVTELREALIRSITPASIPAAQVRRIYDLELGDYTAPRRVRIAALVTRDAGRAARWVKTLRASSAPADALARLLPESEDAAARARDGDLGWIDGRTTQYPESFVAAALTLPRPGAVSGVVVAAGVHHVLLCTDFVAERVSPFAEVEPIIRTKLAERRRREAFEQARLAARKLAEPGLDASSLALVQPGDG